ncbi:hypothetical protein T4E_475 [Trichinella pseudospiralis]|uniref:Uncharacterized protein n=1 Tax=Trichinella pseudospiralis TaxID=6337 RepID=A0A0V0XFF5_TRIPS|nr:hypothetical protein T4E_475 [Trichinella pseudospiralis]
MGDLPATQVNPAGPISNVWIDFAGPLLIRDEGSKYGSKKAYICVFSCTVVRAIHLELVPDQTIEIHYSLGDPVLSLTFWSCEPDRMRDSDLWIVYGTQRNVEGKLDSRREEGLAERAAPQEPKTAEVEPNVRLPRLELPKFDGDVTRFHEFWDQFETSVHRQHGASGVTKLAYLRGCLTGAALNTIEGLSASNKGYKLALQRLRERFDRPMVAVREQILRLVDLLMTKNKLSTICDEFHKKVYALTALGKDPRTSDLSVAEVLIALCREQLPGSVQFRWDELAQANNAVVADLPAFLRFLQQQTDLIGASRRSKEPTREWTKARRSGGERKRNSPESPPRGSATFLQAAVKRKSTFVKSSICRSNVQVCFEQVPVRGGSWQGVPAYVLLAWSLGTTLQGASIEGRQRMESLLQQVLRARRRQRDRSLSRRRSSSQWTSRLQTVRAVAYGEQGPGKRVTCLLDTASERSDRRNPPRDTRRVAPETLIGTSRWQISGTSFSSSFDDANNILCNTQLRTDDWKHLRLLNSAMKDCSDSDQRNGPEDPVAVESVLGWIMCGSSALRHQSQPLSALWILWIRALTGPVGWKCDPEMSEQEKSFWDDFLFDRARYSVRLLKNDGEMELPNHFVSARRRLRAVERRLAQDSVRREHNEGKSGRMWYLSHHVVYQQGPEGIVFDGSEKNQGTSLNDHLDAGPKVQTDLMGILLRFRRFRVVLQSDIAKMYLQVGLHEDERDFCRFLWRDRDCSDTLDIYRLTRVCFGLACLPCASNALPEAADEIKSCKYVDDLVVSCDSVADAKSFVHQTSDLLSQGGFPSQNGLWKTLGISWDPQLDQLPICLLSQATSETQGTKRGLRLAALVFDPLGALTPFTVRAKQLLQSLWQTGISWDSHLPPEISRKWDQWRADLSDLHQIVLPREYLPYSPMEASRLELHGFGDASEAAYAAVVYLRATQSTGVTRVSFVPAKSEVAPLKKLSVPRLELSAALLCVRLVRTPRRPCPLGQIVDFFTGQGVGKVCKGQDRGRYLAQIGSHFGSAGTSRSSLMGSAHQERVCWKFLWSLPDS